MGKEIIRRVFWNQAGFSGLIVGGILAITNLSSYILKDNTSVGVIVNNILFLFAFVVVPYILGKKFSIKNALWGLTFQRALAYMIVMFLLAGFIWGVSTFVVFNYDQQYYNDFFVSKMSGIENVSTENLEALVKSPLSMAFGFVFVMPFFAFLPAFIIAALIRRNPAIKD